MVIDTKAMSDAAIRYLAENWTTIRTNALQRAADRLGYVEQPSIIGRVVPMALSFAAGFAAGAAVGAMFSPGGEDIRSKITEQYNTVISKVTGKGDLSMSSREELYKIAQDLDIPGRSSMDKTELISAIKNARQANAGSNARPVSEVH